MNLCHAFETELNRTMKDICIDNIVSNVMKWENFELKIYRMTGKECIIVLSECKEGMWKVFRKMIVK